MKEVLVEINHYEYSRYCTYCKRRSYKILVRNMRLGQDLLQCELCGRKYFVKGILFTFFDINDFMYYTEYVLET